MSWLIEIRLVLDLALGLFDCADHMGVVLPGPTSGGVTCSCRPTWSPEKRLSRPTWERMLESGLAPEDG